MKGLQDPVPWFKAITVKGTRGSPDGGSLVAHKGLICAALFTKYYFGERKGLVLCLIGRAARFKL